jgi:hypothetical protein
MVKSSVGMDRVSVKVCVLYEHYSSVEHKALHAAEAGCGVVQGMDSYSWNKKLRFAANRGMAFFLILAREYAG